MNKQCVRHSHSVPAYMLLLSVSVLASANAWATPTASYSPSSAWTFAALDDSTAAFVSPSGDVGILEYQDAGGASGRVAPPPAPEPPATTFVVSPTGEVLFINSFEMAAPPPLDDWSDWDWQPWSKWADNPAFRLEAGWWIYL